MSSIRAGVVVRFGLIQFPVSVDSAIDDKDGPSFSTLCDGTMSGKSHAPVRIKQKYGCPTCAVEGGIKDFLKGKDRGDGTYVVVPQSEIDAAAASDDLTKFMSLAAYHATEVDASTTRAGKVYYLTPNGATEAYPVMRDFIVAHPEWAFVTKWAPRSVPHMYRLDVLNDAITLVELAWPDAIKPAPQVKGDYDDDWLTQLEIFVNSNAAHAFDPTAFRDTRAEMLDAYIASQEGVAAGDAPVERPAPNTGAPTLLDQLRAANSKPAKKSPAKRARRSA